MKSWLRAMLITVVLIASIACANEANPPRTKVTGIYSNMSYNKEGDDVLGIEVFLVYSRDGYRVVYQSSDGDPGAPVVLPAKIKEDSISFSLPFNIDPRGDFSGTISATEMVGTFSSSGQTVHLTRRQSYWQ